MLVANNDSSDDKDILQMVAKTVSRAMRKPVNNPIAKAWIENELKKKQAKPNVKLAKVSPDKETVSNSNLRK